MKRRFATLILACVFAYGAGAASSATAAEAPKFTLYTDIVDYSFVKEYATIPVRTDVVLIDARPTRKRYDIGHIPGSINIPDSRFKKLTDQLPVEKDKLLVFYCQGFKCPLSHKSAYKAEALGYTNIKVYAAGIPDWVKNGGFASVSAAYVKRMVDKPGKAVIIDARPKRAKYDKGHVPGAINIPNTQFKKLTDRLPADKDMPLIFYCGGLKCPLSVKSAIKARDLGYTKVRVFQTGYPAWKTAYGPGPKAGAVANAKPKMKIGEEGDTITVDSFKSVMAAAPETFFLIDVRDPGEFKGGHFANSVNIPVDEIEDRVAEIPMDKDVVFVCSTGARSSEAYDIVKMANADFKVFYLNVEIDFDATGATKITPVED